MKFCVIGPAYPFRGGVAQHTTLLCRRLAERDEVEAVTFSRLYPAVLFPGKSQIDPSREAVTFPARPLIDSMNPLTWGRAGKYIRKRRPDLVIVEWWHPFFAPCVGSILSHARAKAVFICHNVLPHEKNPLIKRLTLRALSRGDAFIVHAKEEEDILRAILPNASVACTPLPSTDVFPTCGMSREDARRALGIEGRTVLFFGLVRKYKGLIDLIRAMAQLKGMGITCLVVGEFYDNKRDYVSEIERLGIQDSVRIVDKYLANEEVEQYFSAADVVVLPYRSATQSGVVQVAYHFDRPVIATKVGGIPESVDEGRSGLLVPPGSPEELAGAIRRFFDESLGAAFSDGVREILRKFSWERTIELIESFSGGEE